MKSRCKNKAYVEHRRCLDVVMRKSYHHLVSDLTALSGTSFGKVARHLLNAGDMHSFRHLSWPVRTDKSVLQLKSEYQMESYLKRYRFANDCYSEEELRQRTIDLENQTIMRGLQPHEWQNEMVFRVMQGARILCKEILGSYDPEEHIQRCRFGRRSSVGSPYSQSYIDCKMEGPLTGSKEHIEWFKNTIIPRDNLLRDAILESQAYKLDNPEFYRKSSECSCIQYAMCDTLKHVSVPKSWKIERGVTPNTTIGSFYAAGLGEYMADRLRLCGLDISSLQDTHGFLAKKYSVSRTHVTADLSAASPSILWEHCVRVFERPWLNAMNFGRLRYTILGGDRILNPVFAGMGIGFTFPMQTLLFYCILCSIKKLVGCSGRVSVYGDDLIYPSRMHSVVACVFPKINFIINKDKTYVSENFRESCGSDFYHGCTVRPYSFEGSTSIPNRHNLTATIHKLVNGLRKKWDDLEIPQTLKYFYELLSNLNGSIEIVPPYFPETAGIKCDTPTFVQDWWIPWSIPTWKRYDPPVGFSDNLNGAWFFHYWKMTPEKRVVPSCFPYYWESMRASTAGSGIPHNFEDVRDTVGLNWKRVKPQPKNYRSKNGAKLIKLEPFVAKKGTQSIQKQLGTVPEWHCLCDMHLSTMVLKVNRMRERVLRLIHQKL